MDRHVRKAMSKWGMREQMKEKPMAVGEDRAELTVVQSHVGRRIGERRMRDSRGKRARKKTPGMNP